MSTIGLALSSSAAPSAPVTTRAGNASEPLPSVRSPTIVRFSAAVVKASGLAGSHAGAPSRSLSSFAVSSQA